ncbi:MAG: NADP-reducing hydrogenase subunit HndC [Deltaproteobacteria bacterium ADurb.BinA179]|jgi:electron transport complex protein RnfB|nr:4Fe-4S binding protein [Deltaproteobacteria bacterium]MDI9544061.1 4Fe-4S binding protein [Pseudomonadota bacterium]OPZ27123.1 MAG: NADP-reducing hydrogenase subunit HndC [Deltaproteobacteria bacterium ADurb.BinA179]HNU74292.1 4Fe-4S binding protein [Deltaproteobacteria bacterium]HOD71349.1 4Fe-4S binding protein [Deltaproteobacteria bacterium]
MISSILLLGGIGFLAALILGVSAVTFAVKMDPREQAVLEHLPGANCGACGYAGCAAFAHEITTNAEAEMACPAVNEEALQAISEVLGRTLGGSAPLIACVRCKGVPEQTVNRYEYVGPKDCRAAQLVAGGSKGCRYGCLGLGTCEAVCPFAAIMMGEDGLPHVIESLCTGCGKCIDACPRSIIQLIPRSGNYYVGCISKDIAKDMKPLCKVGCIKCGICADICPFEAITVSKDASAVIEQSKCNRCGLCVSVCPTGIIAAVRMPGKVRISPEKCKGCSICEQVCPVEAISGKVKEPYLVNEGKCIGCGLCIEKCPADAIERIIS